MGPSAARRAGVATLLCGLAALGPATASAEAVERSVSARGNVTSSLGPANFSAANACIAANSFRPFIVQWAGNKFTKTAVTEVNCFDDPAVNPTPPPGFDTQTGRAGGTLQTGGQATIVWRFTDGGPGPHPADQVDFTIRNSANVVLLVVGSQAPGPLGGTPGGVWTFGTPPPNSPPTALLETCCDPVTGEFTSEGEVNSTSRAFTFRGSNSSDPDNNISSWRLDVTEPGGTTTYTGAWPMSDVNHVFGDEGTQNTVTLTVTDAGGLTGTDTTTVIIHFPPPDL